MMKWILSGLAFLAIIFGMINGRTSEVNLAALKECSKAVELTITLAGTICLWSGLMRVAQKSGLTLIIAKLLSPIPCMLFKGVAKTSYAMQLITMNITANLLGLGNAATPLGIAAITELEKDTPKELKGVASNNMITLVVLNTASIQLIPTTAATLRLKYGSANPLDIVSAVLISSLVSVCVALLMTKLFNILSPPKPIPQED
ncbi:MAG: nucleoside recognition domain-containing protein [Oscillospiraceae bacterium]